MAQADAPIACEQCGGAHTTRMLSTFFAHGSDGAIRGAGGGVALAVRPQEINLRQVIEAVEGPIHLNRCLAHPGACPRDVFCTAHPVWQRIQEVLVRELDAVTVASLAAPQALAGPAGLPGKGQETLP